MKKQIALILLISFICCKAFGQSANCKITLSTIDNKAIKFTLVLNDTTIESNDAGVIELSEYILKKRGDMIVKKFRYFNSIDLETFNTPMFTRTTRMLKEYCGQHLIAKSRSFATDDQ